MRQAWRHRQRRRFAAQQRPGRRRKHILVPPLGFLHALTDATCPPTVRLPHHIRLSCRLIAGGCVEGAARTSIIKAQYIEAAVLHTANLTFLQLD